MVSRRFFAAVEIDTSMEGPLGRGPLLPHADSLVSAFPSSRRFEEAPQGTQNLALRGSG